MRYIEYPTKCGNCGSFSNRDSHTCPKAEDVNAGERRPSNYGNLMDALLSRGDKEQMDRIEAKLDELLNENKNP